MARTPLLRAVKRLAAEQHAANREEAAEYSRGEFLKRAGVGGAGRLRAGARPYVGRGDSSARARKHGPARQA